jgi:hypothetical protein
MTIFFDLKNFAFTTLVPFPTMRDRRFREIGNSGANDKLPLWTPASVGVTRKSFGQIGSDPSRRIFAFGAAFIGLCVLAIPAGAHGFGQRYDLPLPLSLYLFGTAAAVILSFVVVGLFARHTPGALGYPRIDLLARWPGRWLAHPALLALLKVVAAGMFLLTVTAGFCGSQDPYRNIAPTLLWIMWWVGLAIFSAFVGDLWAVINPWKSLFDWADRAYRALSGRASLALHLPYSEALGVWPAVGLLLAVAWTELVFPSPAVPANIAWLLLGYSLLTWGGMVLFGSETWVERGEVFAVFFGLFARLAPTEPSTRRRPGIGGLALRPFGAGLLASSPASASMTAFVLLVLSSVLYDGLLTTLEWANAEQQLVGLMPAIGGSAPVAVRSIALVAFWGVFLAAYLAVSAIMSAVAGHRSPRDIARRFALTLVPIAVAYHLAHYLVYLLTQGQYIVPLASDPFGYGWDLFGTAGYRVNIALVGARFAWYAAVTSVVAGHIIAVYLADVRAHQIFGSRRAALRSQVPLTGLMVVYTFVSLSILSEPIVERRPPAQPTAARTVIAIPEDVLLPEAGTGRLQAIGPGRSARLKLTYRVLGSAFHDGTRTTAADLLYAYMFAYRWAARSEVEDRYDPEIATATAPLRQRLKAVRVAGVDTASKSFRIGDVNFIRELFAIDVYLDTPPEDPEQDAVLAPPWSTLPWHLIVLMEEAVGRGWAAFSQAEAMRRGVEWLDLVRSDDLTTRLAALVDQFERQAFRPEILQSLVGAEEARKRWAALSAFYRSHGHLLVTNGPYQLKSWSEKSASLEAFRDLSYPLGVGSYDTYAIPRRGYVTEVEREEGGLRLSADIEIVMKFMRDYQIVRQPMRLVDATVRKRAAPECRYVVVDAAGLIALAGVSIPGEDLRFAIALDGRLVAGQYTVMAEILVNGNAMNLEIERIPVVIGEKQ